MFRLMMVVSQSTKPRPRLLGPSAGLFVARQICDNAKIADVEVHWITVKKVPATATAQTGQTD
jgi:hypothetical protein